MDALALNIAVNTPGVTEPTASDPLTPWSKRVRWVGGLIQAAFAAFWLVRGSSAIGGPAASALTVSFGLAAIGVFCLRDQGCRRHGPAAENSRRRSATERLVTIATVHRVRSGDCLARARQRRGSFRLGAAVDRDHDRTAAALARSPSRRPPLPCGRLAADHRSAGPDRDAVKHRAGRHYRDRRWNAPARNGPRRLSRSRGY